MFSLGTIFPCISYMQSKISYPSAFGVGHITNLCHYTERWALPWLKTAVKTPHKVMIKLHLKKKKFSCCSMINLASKEQTQ